jgi:CYTH domain-containing protein
MKTKNTLIRRKFILLARPENISEIKGIEYEQGYIVSDPARDLRLRRQGRKYFLSCREKVNFPTSYKEIPVTKNLFEELWPFTQGRRISFKRHTFFIKDLKLEMDSFCGEYAPLEIAKIFFPTAAHSKVFEKPAFLGEEVTRREEYETLHMSLHGAPESMGICQIGILPYIFRDKKLHVLLITNSSGTRWILPKGRQEPDMTPYEVASMEAVEEAGALGTVRHDLRVRCHMANGRLLQLYAMKISKLLGNWPEENFRLRRLMPFRDALEMIEDQEVVRAMQRLAVQLKKQL